MANSLEAFRGQIPNELLTALQQDASVPTWPDPTGYSGYFLTNNGAALSWGLPLPDQTGNSGKYLTTNGTVASWATIPSADLGNFVFTDDAMDLAGAAAMQIGGANTTQIDFVFDGTAVGSIVDTGGGNIALQAPSTFKTASVQSAAAAAFATFGDATGVVIGFGAPGTRLTMDGGNVKVLSDTTVERLEITASASSMYSPSQASYMRAADGVLSFIANGSPTRLYSDGSGGVKWVPDTDKSYFIKSADETAWLEIKQSRADLVTQGGQDGFKAANGEVYIRIGNQNGFALLANTTKVLSSGTEGFHVAKVGGVAEISFYGGATVAKQSLPAAPTTAEIATVLGNLSLVTLT